MEVATKFVKIDVLFVRVHVIVYLYIEDKFYSIY